MAIKVNRFEKKLLKNIPTKLKLYNKTTVLIKDHKTDDFIGFIQLCNNADKNEELADRIISTIEDFIEMTENAED